MRQRFTSTQISYSPRLSRDEKCDSLVVKLAFLWEKRSSASNTARLFTPSRIYFSITDISSCVVAVKQLSYSHTPTATLFLPRTSTGLSFAASRQEAYKSAISSGVADLEEMTFVIAPALTAVSSGGCSCISTFWRRRAEKMAAAALRTAFLSLPG